jgi:hypothetical protein
MLALLTNLCSKLLRNRSREWAIVDFMPDLSGWCDSPA